MMHATVLRRLSMLLAALTLAATTQLATAGDGEPHRKIMVSAEGKAQLEPDMAVVTLTVSREAETARAALDAANTAMAEVLEAMRAKGIEDRDLQTSNFSIRPRYTYPEPRSKDGKRVPELDGYTVRNSLSVRVRNMQRLGEILDKSVDLGVNEGGQLLFTNQDPSPALEQARRAAVKAALAKAETLASAAGVKTGGILEISEHSRTPRPVAIAQADLAMARSADAVPVAGGENSYSVTVNLSIEIAQ